MKMHAPHFLCSERYSTARFLVAIVLINMQFSEWFYRWHHYDIRTWQDIQSIPLLHDLLFTKSILWASYQIYKIAGAHAPGMPGTFSLLARVSDPEMHHGTCVTHVPWCMPGSLITVSFEVGGGEKRSRYSRRMRSPQFYVSGKRPMHKGELRKHKPWNE